MSMIIFRQFKFDIIIFFYIYIHILVASTNNDLTVHIIIEHLINIKCIGIRLGDKRNDKIDEGEW